MAEKELNEVLAGVRDIQAKLNVGNLNIRGPVADPVPDFVDRLKQPSQYFNPWKWIIGPVADPAPDFFLPKDKLAKLKIHQIDNAINQLQKEIEGLNLQKDLLKQEYKI